MRPSYTNRVPPAAWPVSPDGDRLYLGYKHDYDRHSDNRFYLDYGADPRMSSQATPPRSQFRVLDTHRWRKVGTIRTKMAFWSAAIAHDGRSLYAIAPEKHSILVIDAVRMKQVKILKIGGMPSLAIVAP